METMAVSPSAPSVSTQLPAAHASPAAVEAQSETRPAPLVTSASKDLSARGGENQSDNPLEYLQDHAEHVSVLAARLRTIRIAKSLWVKGMKSAALEQLAKANNAGATIDFLRGLDIIEKPTDVNPEPVSLTHITRVLTIEQFALILPLLKAALVDANDALLISAAAALTILLKAFGSAVIVGLRGSQTRARPVAPIAVFRSASAEILAIRKVVGSEPTYARRSLRVKRARKDLASVLRSVNIPQ
jgi:hypothetical protein